MLIIIFSWIYLFVVIFLVGKLFLNNKLLSFLKLDNKFEWYEYFWAGTFVVFGILQIWSIFWSINIIPIILFSTLAIISLIISFKNGIKFPKKIDYRFLIFLALGLFVLSYYASQQTGMADTMGYHLNAVKWLSTYPTVPGLANLHSRLGFNTSFFQFAAMLNHLFLQNKVTHVALSFFFAVLFAEISWILLKPGNRIVKLFAIFVTPGIIAGILNGGILSSLYYDYALVAVVIATSIELLRGGKNSLMLVILLSTLSFTLKLSGASFSILIFLFAAIKLLIDNKKLLIKSFLAIGVLEIFILAPYLIRNVILSGWLLYPYPFLKLNFDWTVPIEKVRNLYLVIQAWARVPGIEYVNYYEVGFWKWFPVWFKNNSTSVDLKLLLLSLMLLFILGLMHFRKNDTRSNPKECMYLVFASLVSVFYMLITAPDFRFGGIFVWVLFACTLVLLYLKFEWNRNIIILTILGLLIFTISLSWPLRIESEPYLKSLRWDQALPTKNINGILMPSEDSCGNSDLPCTPEKNNIIWRVPGDLSNGFAPTK